MSLPTLPSPFFVYNFSSFFNNLFLDLYQHNLFNKIKGSCKNSIAFVTKSAYTDTIEDCAIACYTDQKCLSFNFQFKACRKHYKPCIIEEIDEEDTFIYDKKEKSKYSTLFLFY